jgi:hypothetical protein
LRFSLSVNKNFIKLKSIVTACLIQIGNALSLMF